ncbi:putative PQ loop repeat [Trypanosoma vivax]|uniref:Mannose-P-dolichol utilization defect 1 protein homolog n=1 Tax=Trypanosoma vivax (strain Y486) TaxID=1055687 RepID=G0TYK4_TRYVY|nr:hypothetical protein TRVL_06794 [Trypanosoma vivax]KAH8611224.1 putative PQ loop repeat [Trypanosoma vivax]CCC49051.1 conserved hypothetical protein [Trypanosoma vivax Y486]
MEVHHSAHIVASDDAYDFDTLARRLVATLLPYAIVYGSLLLKVPQIIKVVKNWSADGISLTSLFVELTSYVITSSWGFAQAMDFKDYGESVLIMMEVILLLVLVGYLQNHLKLVLALVAVGFVGSLFLSIGLVPYYVHRELLRIQIFFALSSRVPQIIMNYRNRSTGQLSGLTFFLAMAGGISRLLTTFHNVPVEKGRDIILSQFGLVVVLNYILVMQCIVYRSKGRKLTDSACPEGFSKKIA